MAVVKCGCSSASNLYTPTFSEENICIMMSHRNWFKTLYVNIHMTSICSPKLLAWAAVADWSLQGLIPLLFPFAATQGVVRLLQSLLPRQRLCLDHCSGRAEAPSCVLCQTHPTLPYGGTNPLFFSVFRFWHRLPEEFAHSKSSAAVGKALLSSWQAFPALAFAAEISSGAQASSVTCISGKSGEEQLKAPSG